MEVNTVLIATLVTISVIANAATSVTRSICINSIDRKFLTLINPLKIPKI
jgi:hypothetical protein